MKHIELNENNKRSFSSSIYIIEKLIIEIEMMIKNLSFGSMSEIVNDFDSDEQFELVSAQIDEIKKYISYLQKKYHLKIDKTGMQWFIQTRKTKMWEILCDNTSVKMRKSYGGFPPEYAEEFDKDITKLMKLIDEI